MGRPYCQLAVAAAVLATPLARAEVTVPLYREVIPMNAEGTAHKIAWGIYVKIGQGGHHRLFQLDTGNSELLAGYAPDASPQWWGAFTPSGSSGHTDFGSGVKMDWQQVQALVTLSDDHGSNLITTSQPVTLAQVTAATAHDLADGEWAQRMSAGKPGLHRTYFGNFGANLHAPGRPDSPSHGLLTVLAQLTRPGGDKIRGFVLHLGDVLQPVDAHLTLYFDSDFAANPDLLASYTLATPMAPDRHPAAFPVTGYRTASEFPMQVQAIRVGDAEATDGAPYLGLIDTGGTSIAIPEDPALAAYIDGHHLRHGHPFALKLPGDGGTGSIEVGFRTGETRFVDRVEVIRPRRAYNFGMALLNYYDVYFDLAGTDANGHQPRMLFRPLEGGS